MLLLLGSTFFGYRRIILFIFDACVLIFGLLIDHIDLLLDLVLVFNFFGAFDNEQSLLFFFLFQISLCFIIRVDQNIWHVFLNFVTMFWGSFWTNVFFRVNLLLVHEKIIELSCLLQALVCRWDYSAIGYFYFVSPLFDILPRVNRLLWNTLFSNSIGDVIKLIVELCLRLMIVVYILNHLTKTLILLCSECSDNNFLNFVMKYVMMRIFNE